MMSFPMQRFRSHQRRLRQRLILAACIEASAAAVLLAAEQMEQDNPANQPAVQQERRPRQQRSCQTRPWLQRRELYGQYEHLMREIKEEDPKAFQIFQRLTPTVWNELYEKVAPRLQRKVTPMRDPISPGLRLAITLRFLASGDSYRTHMFGFRVADNTICGIVPETCKAIHEVLAEEYFKVHLNRIIVMNIHNYYISKLSSHIV